MIILVSGSTNLIRTFNSQTLGGLVTPQAGSGGASYSSLKVKWAMDNDCFKGLKRGAYTNMLKRNQPYAKSCLWVTVPDVVGNAEATLERFHEWKAVVKSFGYPLAFVVQDGIENIEIPWNEFDCLFIGGTTEFKTGATSKALVKQAKELGKWVHMGRVSTPGRLKLAMEWGCDSVDSTAFSRAGNKNLSWALDLIENTERAA